MEKLINEFSFGLFFWQLFIFIGLVLLLRKFAWKPILDAVNERETSIKDAMNSAEEAKKRNGLYKRRQRKSSKRSPSRA
jgi:F-type H+-transporting ATPase subunit b